MSGWDTWKGWPIEEESQTQTHPSEMNEFTKSTHDFNEQKPAEAYQDVYFSDTQYYKSEEEEEEFFGSTNNEYHPLRPNAEDCTFYMKTGKCKFKLACKYNHPNLRDNQGGKGKEVLVEQRQQHIAKVECKYYHTPGGCKFGEACKFRHSMDLNRIEPPELNFCGLPIRLGEKKCPFYMRTGSCAYGVKCIFHHPNPNNLGASNPGNKAQDNSFGNESGSPEKHASEPDSMLGSPASQPAAEPWAPHMIMRETALYLENQSLNFPKENQSLNFPKDNQSLNLPEENQSLNFPEAVVSGGEKFSMKWEWGECQTPGLSQEETEQTILNTQVNDSLEQIIIPPHYLRKVESENYPERPGQPECAHYMKTSYCKFGSACRYHHPKNRSSKLHIGPLKDRNTSQKSLYGEEKRWRNKPNSEGYNLASRIIASMYNQQRQTEEFPQRPGHPECSYFMKSGDCKFRSACRYHHPKDCSSTNCALNSKGLPLRPGRKMCDNFKRYGICKYGRSCMLDHSEQLGQLESFFRPLISSDGSSSNVSSGSEFAREESKQFDCRSGDEAEML